MSRLRSLLATLRIANAPSVVSNVWLGFMLGWVGVSDFYDSSQMAWGKSSLTCLAGLLLYFSGNLANDWFDRKWDAKMRPERALPSGLFHPAAYLTAAIILATTGVTLSFFLNPMSGYAALLIVLAITIYTYFHKRAIWAVVPMGLCRAGLYFLGFFATWLTLDQLEAAGHAAAGSHALSKLETPTILGVGLFCYIAGLSLSARYEGMPDAPRGPKVISLAMLILPIPAMSSSFMGYDPDLGILGMLPFAVWLALCLTRFKKPIPRYVSALLAGMPLVDFIAAAPLALGLGRMVASEGKWWNLPQLVTLLVLPLVAFILGRALQKLAPAT